MDKNKVQVTKAGLEELKKEYENLVHVVRQEVIADLQAARAQGDLSENADYDAARDRQAQVEARIIELDTMLQNIEIISETKTGSRSVRLGSKVTIRDLEHDEVETYIIVGSVEADPLNGKLSNVSPLAAALLEHKTGDVVTVLVDAPYEVKIEKIA
jgi:transcription elongation factor GreA